MDSRLISYFTPEIRNILMCLGDDVTEIRMRKCLPLIVKKGRKIFYVMTDGCLSSILSGKCLIVTEQCFNRIFEAICRYSVHSFQENICNGYITLEGGHRVGICGTSVIQDGKIINVKNVSSLNFRVAHSVKGCADELYEIAFKSKLINLLIVSPPSQGKTTILRELCRKLSMRYNIALIDERGEIAAVYNGIAQNDVGINTDIFDGYVKDTGIETAVRVMAPDVIICDEICTGDTSAIGYALSCGVNICATLHGESIEDVKSKLSFYKAFDMVVFLDKGRRPGVISEIKRINKNDEDESDFVFDDNNINDRK